MIDKILPLLLASVLIVPASAIAADTAFTVVDRDVYIDGPIVDVTAYTDLIAAVDHCQGEIHLYINSPGGDLFTAYALSDSIKKSNCKVDITVRGVAASAAALIAVSGDSLEMSEGSLLMFHNVSIGGRDSITLLEQRIVAISSSFKEFLKVRAGHILTDKEIQDVMEGKEVWINKRDVDRRTVVSKTVQSLESFLRKLVDRGPE